MITLLIYLNTGLELFIKGEKMEINDSTIISQYKMEETYGTIDLEHNGISYSLKYVKTYKSDPMFHEYENEVELKDLPEELEDYEDEIIDYISN
jgi:hypothetical protein